MGIVTQASNIFEGTLRENLIPHSSEKKLHDNDLVKILRSLGFKKNESINLDMILDTNGENLSMGEKQLISLARVIFYKKKLIILDEATSNVDLKIESKVQDLIKNVFEKSTMFIIAHRINTILECDKIMVLINGEIAEFDTPEKLRNTKNGYFKEIVEKLNL